MLRTRILAVTALPALVLTMGSINPVGAATKKVIPASVSIKDFAFKVVGTAKPGATVKITNNDGALHTFSADDKSFDAGTIRSGKFATVKVGKAGVVKFHCNFHPSMKGTLTIK